MIEKKYEIVRVDTICPPIKMFCSDRKINCETCLYGDTKEQLITKVEVALRRITNNGFVVQKNKSFGRTVNIGISFKRVAKEIIEFLGVENDNKKQEQSKVYIRKY